MSVSPRNCERGQPGRLRSYGHKTSRSCPPQSRRPRHPDDAPRTALDSSGLSYASDPELYIPTASLRPKLEDHEAKISSRQWIQHRASAVDILGHPGGHMTIPLRGAKQAVTIAKSEGERLDGRNSQFGKEYETLKPPSPFKPSPRLCAAHRATFVAELDSRMTFSNTVGTMNGAVNDGSDKCPTSSPDPAVQDPGSNSSMSPEQFQNTEHESNSETDRSDESEPYPESDMEDAEETTQPPLTYQIPPDVLFAAQQAQPKTRTSYWSQLLYRGPKEEKISVHYCSKVDVAERVAKYFLNEKVIGFDMEWKPYAPSTSIKQNASLIQIACENRIALFHISRFFGTTPAQLVPRSLKLILENPDIRKVGVNIQGDFTRLRKHLGINGQGLLELSRLHNLVECPEAGNRLCRLSTQVQQHLLLPLYKGEALVEGTNPTTDESTSKEDCQTGDSSTEQANDAQKSTAERENDIEEPTTSEVRNTTKTQRTDNVRQSDWTQPLNREQIHYAADDAYAGFRLFDVLNAKRKKMKPIPLLPQNSDGTTVTRSIVRKVGVSRKPTDDTTRVRTEAIPAIEEAGDGAEEYETAPEYLSENQEEELESESASELGSESSSLDDDYDCDYIPNTMEWRRLRKDEMESATDPPTSSRRVERLKVSRVQEATATYSVLPVQSSTGAMSDSETSSATGSALTKSLDVDDEFADPVLEEAMLDIELDQFTGEIRAENTRAVGITNMSRRASKAMMASTHSSQPSDGPTPTLRAASPVPNMSTTTQTDKLSTATAWARMYLDDSVPVPSSSSRPARIHATTCHLRAYYLWHHMGVSPQDLGGLLRDPPLAQGTVLGYILKAISLEKLEYNEERLRDVLEMVPEPLRVARWGSLLKRLQR